MNLASVAHPELREHQSMPFSDVCSRRASTYKRSSSYHQTLERVFVVAVYVLLALTFPLSLVLCICICHEYERVVVLRLGRLLGGGTKGPGLCFVLPCLDVWRKVDLRVMSFVVPPQELLSQDSVTVSIEAMISFRIIDPVKSVTNVRDAFYSTKLLAQTTLRNVFGSKRLSQMLSQREEIAQLVHEVLDDAVFYWGIKHAIECGEKRANTELLEAASTISLSPTAMQLRYLQELETISNKNNRSIIIPIPVGLLNMVADWWRSSQPSRIVEREESTSDLSPNEYSDAMDTSFVEIEKPMRPKMLLSKAKQNFV